jgi:hypothetical protein
MDVCSGDELINATNAGSVSEERLTDMAIRVLLPYYALGQDGDSYPEVNFDQSSLSDDAPYGNQVGPCYLHFIAIQSMRES